eukprot:6181482-Pleurochrysis_carterae.AAC.1
MSAGLASRQEAPRTSRGIRQRAVVSAVTWTQRRHRCVTQGKPEKTVQKRCQLLWSSFGLKAHLDAKKSCERGTCAAGKTTWYDVADEVRSQRAQDPRIGQRSGNLVKTRMGRE